MAGPTWPEVILTLVNAVQLIALAYISLEQGRSARERDRRAALEDCERRSSPSGA